MKPTATSPLSPRRIPGLLTRFWSYLRHFYWRKQGLILGKRIALHQGVEIACRHPVTGGGRVEIGDDCELSRNVILHPYRGSILLHSNVFIGPHAVIYGHGGVEIGEATLISMHCRILSSEHRIPSMDLLIRSQEDLLKPTRIGKDVWLGAGVSVLGGVTIGDGCVVGAGAVVTKDLPPGAIAYGVPAVVKGWRPQTPA